MYIHRFVNDEQLFKGRKFVIDGQDMEEKVQTEIDSIMKQAEQDGREDNDEEQAK